jgi:5-methylcytosine-specific restriction endonuclease McrA
MKTSLNNEVLKLNKNWQVIGVISARQCFEDMCADAVTALNCDDGYMIPMRMKEWMNLPIRENDDYISTARAKIRVPRVCIAVRFDKLIVKPPKLTLKNLRDRDKDTCIYTGKKLKPSEMSIEHVKPESLGGKTIWENVALAHRDVNSKRGNLPLEKVGLKLRYQPFAPRPAKPSELIQNKHKYPEWDLFLKN